MVHLFPCDTSFPAAYAVKERKSKWPGLHKQNSHPWPEFGTAGAKTRRVGGLVIATWVLAEGSLEGRASQGSSFLWVAPGLAGSTFLWDLPSIPWAQEEAALQTPQQRNKEPISCNMHVTHPHPEPTLPEGMFQVCIPDWGNHQRLGSGLIEPTVKWISVKTHSPALHKPPFWLGSGAQWCFGSINPFQCRANVL